MSKLRVAIARCRALIIRKRLDEDLDEELRTHLEMLAEENVRHEIPLEEARYAALRTFGGIDQVREIYREQRGLPMIETFAQDLRFAFRQLRRNPGFTTVVVLTLALGIGANTAIFSVVNAVMLRPLPYPQSDRLVWIAESIPALKVEIATGGDYVDWKNQNHTLEEIAAYDTSAAFNLTGRGTPARVRGASVGANFFRTLGVQPQLGRGFTPQECAAGVAPRAEGAGRPEDQPNGPHAMILMHPFWQQYFGSDPRVLGQTVNLDAAPYTVVGVMPASFRFPGDADAQFLVPLALNKEAEGMRTSHADELVRIIGRLKPGVSLAAVWADLNEIRKRAQSSSGPTMAEDGGGQGHAMRTPGPGGPGGQLRSSASSLPETAPNGSSRSETARATGPSGMLSAPRRASGSNGGAGPNSQKPDQPRLGRSAPPASELRVVPLAEHLAGNLRPAMLTLLGVVSLVLLIACANVANLMLTRASARTREMAVRAALGAGRWRLVRQLLVESVTLALAGGVVGLLFAAWGVDVIARLIPAGTGRGILSVAIPRVDSNVLLFALAASVLTGILFGLAPAVTVTRPDLGEGLKESAQAASPGASHGWLRGALAVAELSLALVLLIGAGLLIKSFYRVLEVNPGFAPERLLTMDLNLTDSRYPTPQQQSEFFSEVLSRVESLPGVRSAALSDSLPLSPYSMFLMMSVDRLLPRAPVSSSTTVMMSRISVSPGYFYTLGIPVLKGRTFTGHDDEQSLKVAVVNEALANHLWPGEDPVGKQLPLFNANLTVIGVVGNTRHNGLSEDTTAETYVPFLQAPGNSMQLAVRASVEPDSLVSAVRAQVRDIDPDQPLYHVSTMEQILSDSLAPRRFNLLLLAIFAAIALTLATVGIYGVMAFSVTQRTHEIGIRMALGAERRNVLGLIVRQGLRLTLAGVVIGVAGAWGLTRFLSSFLYGVRPTDPWTFVLVSVVLVAVAIMASYIPARRATKVDLIVALRYE